MKIARGYRSLCSLAHILRNHPRPACVDLALLHLGGPQFLDLVTATRDAKEGVRMMKIIVRRKAIPIHYNDYAVFISPLGNFEREIKRAGLQDKIGYLASSTSRMAASSNLVSLLNSKTVICEIKS